MTTPTQNDKGFAESTVKGTLTLSALRWVVRFVGIISVSITARILTPEDFGIHSSAALFLSFILILQSVGLQEFLIKEKTVDDASINTSWTIRIIIAAFVTLIAFAGLPFMAEIVNEPRATISLAILAVIPLIDAFENPQIMVLLRRFEYNKIFTVRLIERGITFVCSVGCVVFFQTFWSIALGMLLSSTVFCGFTYVYWSYRPSFSVSKVGSVGRFAVIALGRAMTEYVSQSADSYAVRQFATSAVFGLYHNGKELARNLVFEVAGQVGTAMMPAVARIKDDKPRLTKALVNALGVTTLFTGLLSLGLHFTAEQVIGILLGQQWLIATPFLKVLALSTGIASLYNVLKSTLVGLDRQGTVLRISAFKMILMVSTSIALMSYREPLYFLYLLLGANTLQLMITLLCLHKNVALLKLIGGMMRPLAAIVLTFLAMQWLLPRLEYANGPAVLQFIVYGAAVTVIYAFANAALWFGRGRPAGPETALWSQFKAMVAK